MIFTFMLGLATGVVSVFVAAHVDNRRRMKKFAKNWHERFMGRPLTPSELL